MGPGETVIMKIPDDIVPELLRQIDTALAQSRKKGYLHLEDGFNEEDYLEEMRQETFQNFVEGIEKGMSTGYEGIYKSLNKADWSMRKTYREKTYDYVDFSGPDYAGRTDKPGYRIKAGDDPVEIELKRKGGFVPSPKKRDVYTLVELGIIELEEFNYLEAWVLGTDKSIEALGDIIGFSPQSAYRLLSHLKKRIETDTEKMSRMRKSTPLEHK